MSVTLRQNGNFSEFQIQIPLSQILKIFKINFFYRFSEASLIDGRSTCGGPVKISRNAEELLADAKERSKLMKNPKKLVKEYEEQMHKEMMIDPEADSTKLSKLQEDLVKYIPMCNKTNEPNTKKKDVWEIIILKFQLN